MQKNYPELTRQISLRKEIPDTMQGFPYWLRQQAATARSTRRQRD